MVQPPAVPGVSVVTLDQESLFSRSALGQRIIADLERDRTALQAENRRIEAELQAEEQDLTARRADMTPQDFAPLAADFDEKVQRIRDAQDGKARALQQRLDAGRQSFAAEAGPVIAAIARDHGAVVVLDATVVLMAFDSADITDEAVERLDAALGDGRSELAPPSPELRPLPRAGGARSDTGGD